MVLKVCWNPIFYFNRFIFTGIAYAPSSAKFPIYTLLLSVIVIVIVSSQFQFVQVFLEITLDLFIPPVLYAAVGM